MAETPPPFNPAAPQAGRKQSNPIIWILVALGAACCVCIIAGSFMTYTAAKQGAEFAACPMTMSLANASLREYVEENGAFPEAATWQEDIEPYYEKRVEEFNQEMSDSGPLRNFFKLTKPGDAYVCFDGQSQQTGIHFNSDLAGKKPDEVENVEDSVTLFEADSVSLNASSQYEANTEQSEQVFIGKTREYFSMYYSGELRSGDGEKVNIEIN